MRTEKEKMLAGEIYDANGDVELGRLGVILCVFS